MKKKPQPGRDKRGRFRKGTSGGKLLRKPTSIPTSAAFLERLAAITDPQELAYKIRALGRKGDWAALSLMVESLRYMANAPKTNHQPIDYSVYSEQELRTLIQLSKKGTGQLTSDVVVVPPPLPIPDHPPPDNASESAVLSAEPGLDGESEPESVEESVIEEQPEIELHDPNDPDLKENQEAERQRELQKYFVETLGRKQGDSLGVDFLKRPPTFRESNQEKIWTSDPKWVPRRLN